jgi:hypothetical protein
MNYRTARAAALALAVAVAAGCEDSTSAEPELTPSMSVAGANGPVVMTRNLYLGADLTPLIGIDDAGQIPFVAAEVWAIVQATDFTARAGALAAEIARERPHLVGLQEAALYQIQSPGDAVLGGSEPATDVVYDFVQLLLDSLAARGASYTAAIVNGTTQVEVPVYTGQGPLPFDDVRFTLRDAILVRGDVTYANAQASVYGARLDFPIGGAGGPEVSMRRGWVSVDAAVGGHVFRFASTHFEVQQFAPIQEAQAAELIAALTASPLPVVVVGDFNSTPDGLQTASYGMLVAAGFRDIWEPRGSAGYTCCHVEDLTNHHPTLDQRLDIVFIRGFDTERFRADGAARIIGDRPGDRLRGGLWPSDHAGVVALLRLPPPGHIR